MTDIASNLLPVTFHRYGRSYQMAITSPDDLHQAADLQEAHWVATSAGVDTLNCDRAFLAYVDTDNKGRILHHELRDAIGWLFRVLADPEGIADSRTTLRLATINISDEEGQRIDDAARKILKRLGTPDADAISLEQVRQVKTQVEAQPVSEAGVVLPSAADDPDVQAFLADILATVGGTDHSSGAKGVDKPHLDDFLAQAAAHLAWAARGDLPEDTPTTNLMPLGPQTPAAVALVARLKPKIRQYFTLCQAVAFQQRLARRLDADDDALRALDLQDPSAVEDFLTAAPLAQPRSDRLLDLNAELNPLFEGDLQLLRKNVLPDLLAADTQTLSPEQWQKVTSALSPYEAWAASKAGAAVEPLGREKLATYLDPRFAEAAEKLIARKARSAFVMDNLRLTEKLILFQAHLMTLANNFISFPYLYKVDKRALFEMGSLIMDGRIYSLAIRVLNRAEHLRIAATGSAFLLYVEILNPDGSVRYEVAVPVTAGGRKNLCLGKRGIFHDVTAAEFDARVVHIIDNPINMREALVSPFQRLGRLIGGKFEALTASAEKEFDSKVSGQMDQATTTAPLPAAAAAPPAPARPQQQSGGIGGAGLLMGGGVAIAAVGSAMAYITKTLSGVAWWKILIGLAAAVLAVMLPAAIAGLFKLRRRDLSALLEASGWAINARMRLTFKQGRFFTRRPLLPIGGLLKRLWPLWAILTILIVAAIALGIWNYTRPTHAPTTHPTPQTTQTTTPS